MLRHTLFPALLLAPVFALAQAPGAPAPGWQQGRPAEMAQSPLAPHPQRLTATPVERIPVANIRVPEGFQVELWAHGLPGARVMVRGDNGTVFVGTRAIGRVYAVRDGGSERQVSTLLQGLPQPSGLAVHNGALFVSAIHRLLRIDDVEQNLSNPQPVDLTAAFNLPTEVHHGWTHIQFDREGRLWISRGVPCNICDTDESRFGLIKAYRPDGTDLRIEARGVRNSVGFDFHPRTGALWFTNRGRDWAGQDQPSDTLHVHTRRGEHYGFPWCHGGWQDPAVSGRMCSEFRSPDLNLGAHVAPIGTHFYRGAAFPERYRNALFIANRGSWNRPQLSGFNVVVVREEGGRLVQEEFLTGLRDDANQRFLGRPAGLLTMPDGSLLVSDEENGAIYRVSARR